MNEEVKKDILSIIERAQPLLDKEDSSALAELSNHTTHSASIFQDDDSITIAVVVYALSKILLRQEVEGISEWKDVKKKFIADLKMAYASLEQQNVVKYRKLVKELLRHVSEIDDRLQLFIEHVITEAKVKKGSKLYEHGISIERAAQILGVSQWELMSYIGKTKIVDEIEEECVSCDLRVEFAKKLFGVNYEKHSF
ncbi:MAG: hypothetical protein QW331_01195 [Candidatus Woesearchaeota archaeon]